MLKVVRKFIVVLDESSRAVSEDEGSNPGRVGSASIVFEVPQMKAAKDGLCLTAFQGPVTLPIQRERVIEATNASNMWQLVWKVLPYSTQNRGALFATIGTLEFFNNMYPDDALFFYFFYDSQYMSDMFVKRRLYEWSRMGWMSARTHAAPENLDLLKRLVALMLEIRKRNPKDQAYRKIHQVDAEHTPAHSQSRTYIATLNRWVDRYSGMAATHSQFFVQGAPLTLHAFNDETYKTHGVESTQDILTTEIPGTEVYSQIGKVYNAEDIIVKEEEEAKPEATKDVRLHGRFASGNMWVRVSISCSAKTGKPIHHNRNVGVGGHAYLSNAYALIELGHFIETEDIQDEAFNLYVQDPLYKFLRKKSNPKKNREIWAKAADIFKKVENQAHIIRY